MTEVTRAEFEQLRHQVERNCEDIARHDTQYAVISTKLTAILWLLGTVSAAVIVVIVKMLVGVAV